jgi:protein ImuB
MSTNSLVPAHWIALLPPESDGPLWRLQALRFTPYVAQVQELLLLEVAASERLFGGRRALLNQFFRVNGVLARIPWQQASSSLSAMGLLRCQGLGLARPALVPDGLPLSTLDAAQAHVATLERMGVRTWGQLRALPRDGVARRFGAALLDALDQAWGQRPERHTWLALPSRFDERLDLPATAHGIEGLAGTLTRLLALLRLWLVARQLGVLRLQLRWAHDLKRLDGIELPPHAGLALHTAEPTQDLAHLRRLLDERLNRTTLAAPVRSLRLRTIEAVSWAGASRSFLPEDNRPGDKLHQLVERLGARLGTQQVQRLQPQADHRPECQQRWVDAQVGTQTGAQFGAKPASFITDVLYPPWLLPQPLPLQVHHEVPQYGGPLQRLARLHRVEAAWWEAVHQSHPGVGSDSGGQPALRDYFIAHSPEKGLVWVYRERFQWFLHGIYA